MSAEQIAESPTTPTPRAQLTVVPRPTATVSTLGFVGIVVTLVALGLGAVMIVTTSVGAQSRELSSLRRQATELGYQSAAYESQLQRISSANALAMRATELGMVPNPYPAFINLADRSVTGVPTKVIGDEMPFLRGVASKPLAAEPVLPTAPPAEAAPPAAAEQVAAASTEDQP